MLHVTLFRIFVIPAISCSLRTLDSHIAFESSHPHLSGTIQEYFSEDAEQRISAFMPGAKFKAWVVDRCARCYSFDFRARVEGTRGSLTPRIIRVTRTDRALDIDLQVASHMNAPQAYYKISIFDPRHSIKVSRQLIPQGSCATVRVPVSKEVLDGVELRVVTTVIGHSTPKRKLVRSNSPSAEPCGAKSLREPIDKYTIVWRELTTRDQVNRTDGTQPTVLKIGQAYEISDAARNRDLRRDTPWNTGALEYIIAPVRPQVSRLNLMRAGLQLLHLVMLLNASGTFEFFHLVTSFRGDLELMDEYLIIKKYAPGFRVLIFV